MIIIIIIMMMMMVIKFLVILSTFTKKHHYNELLCEKQLRIKWNTILFYFSSGARGDWGTCPPKSEKLAKLSKKNGIRLVGYTFRLKNYVKISPPPSFKIFQSWRRHCYISLAKTEIVTLETFSHFLMLILSHLR